MRVGSDSIIRLTTGLVKLRINGFCAIDRNIVNPIGRGCCCLLASPYQRGLFGNDVGG